MLFVLDDGLEIEARIGVSGLFPEDNPQLNHLRKRGFALSQHGRLPGRRRLLRTAEGVRTFNFCPCCVISRLPLARREDFAFAVICLREKTVMLFPPRENHRAKIVWGVGELYWGLDSTHKAWAAVNRIKKHTRFITRPEQWFAQMVPGGTSLNHWVSNVTHINHIVGIDSAECVRLRYNAQSIVNGRGEEITWDTHKVLPLLPTEAKKKKE